VIDEPRPTAPAVPPRRGGLVPAAPMAVQAAAVAVTGLAAGAVTVAAVKRRRARKSGRRLKRRRSPAAEIVATRSFLIDVHFLAGD